MPVPKKTNVASSESEVGLDSSPKDWLLEEDEDVLGFDEGDTMLKISHRGVEEEKGVKETRKINALEHVVPRNPSVWRDQREHVESVVIKLYLTKEINAKLTLDLELGPPLKFQKRKVGVRNIRRWKVWII